MDKIISLGRCSIGEIVQNNINIEEINPFDRGLSFLNSQGYSCASAEEIATARLELRNPDIYIGGFVKEAVIYVPNTKELILTRKSPVIANAERAAFVGREGIDGGQFYLTREELEPYLEDSSRFSFEDLPLEKDIASRPYVPADRLQDEPITAFLFGKKARQYGEFLKSDLGLDYFFVNVFENGRKPSDNGGWPVDQVGISYASKGELEFGCRSSLHYDSMILSIK